MNVIGLLGGVRATVFATALVLASGALWVQGKRIESYQRTARVQQTAIFDLTSANRLTQRAVDSLKAANTAWANRSRVNAAQVRAITTQAAIDTERHQAALQAARNKRAAIYRGNDHASEWASTAVPADVFASVRGLAPGHPARRSD